MSVLHSYFDYQCNQCSPVRDDYERRVNYDDEGKEYITYEKVDYPSYQKSLGDSSLWSIDALLQAGINPNFSINTGFGTRLQGIDTIKQAQDFVDKLVADSESKTE